MSEFKKAGQPIHPANFRDKELVCDYHLTTHEPVSVSGVCRGFWRDLTREEDR